MAGTLQGPLEAKGIGRAWEDTAQREGVRGDSGREESVEGMTDEGDLLCFHSSPALVPIRGL